MEKGEKFQREKIGKPGYLNENCWLVKALNYAPYKRCRYCELKFHNCLFLHYQIISLILIILILILSFLIERKNSELLIISVFTLVIVYGYFFNKSTDKIIKANFAQRKAKEAEMIAQQEVKMREEAERFKIISLKLKEKISQVLDLEEVISRIIDTLIETFKIDKISFALKQLTSEFYQFHKTIGFSEKELATVIKDTGICYYLGEAKRPLTKNDLKEIQDILEKNKIGLLLPLFQKQLPIGIIFLGEKPNVDSYSKEDIALLESLSYQISISLNNALLYEEIKKDKEALEKFYHLTVGRELRMAELKKKIKELEEKLKKKEEIKPET